MRSLGVICLILLFSLLNAAPFPGVQLTENQINMRVAKELEEQGIVVTEGDMRSDSLMARNVVNAYQRWPNKEVIYQYDTTITAAHKSVIQQAFSDISSKTCIKFTQRTNQADYIKITNGPTGCWSYVGKLGSMQELNLDSRSGGSCMVKGIVIHEVLHALGAWHTQSRPDRDTYVTIMTANIIKGQEHNFDKQPASAVQMFSLDYDFGSIMHYAKNDFSTSYAKPTIVPKKSGVTIGQRTNLSAGDIQRLKKLYQC